MYRKLRKIQENFNSRLRKETNGVGHSKIWAIEDFNSRLRKETNISHRLIYYVSYISTHVSARERTPSFKYSLNALSVLQLTSPQGDEPMAL